MSNSKESNENQYHAYLNQLVSGLKPILVTFYRLYQAADSGESHDESEPTPPEISNLHTIALALLQNLTQLGLTRDERVDANNLIDTVTISNFPQGINHLDLNWISLREDLDLWLIDATWMFDSFVDMDIPETNPDDKAQFVVEQLFELNTMYSLNKITDEELQRAFKGFEEEFAQFVGLLEVFLSTPVSNNNVQDSNDS